MYGEPFTQSRVKVWRITPCPPGCLDADEPPHGHTTFIYTGGPNKGQEGACASHNPRDSDSLDSSPVVYLPHSCDEWIIGGEKEVGAMIADLRAALVEIRR